MWPERLDARRELCRAHGRCARTVGGVGAAHASLGLGQVLAPSATTPAHQDAA
jgi:hypothetical protein